MESASVLESIAVVAIAFAGFGGIAAGLGYRARGTWSPDDQMRLIRDKGSVIGADRIAVMAAVNITHELLHKTTDSATISDIVSKRIKSLREKVEVALNQTNQLEL